MTQTLHYVTDEHGERTAVILPIQDYEQLLEDLEDLVAAAKGAPGPLIPHAEVVGELKRDGLL